MLAYKPSRLSLAHLPTPIRPLDRLSRPLGGPRIWLKQDDFTGSAQTGNKLRKLEFVVAEALAQGCDTLITCGGVQSNHCRTAALVGAQLGLKVHLLLRGDPASCIDGNLLMDHMAGAEVSIYPDDEYVANLGGIFQHWKEYYQSVGRSAYVIPTGASDEVGLWGYLQASEELLNDFKQNDIQPDAIVVATGSGGTQAGLTLGLHLQGSLIPVHGVAVCDSELYFHNKVRSDISAWQKRWGAFFNKTNLDELLAELRIHTLDAYIGPGYAQGYDELFQCIQMVAQEEGIILDPVYTGKAFYGLVSEIKSGIFSGMEDIVFVHTGGVFGLFPYRNVVLGR
ncbi:D-cysteine desulfhydrase family protein [Teredinibacter haidensis]|uniref:D-cysteine desulfhydrase family protein n=1 Tax=Teredinibacter haidensis TaxID=2731755 RepID=UPI000948E575|nr:D-cysteine desulfhydrase family protein [Teredinibacter haidensis]